MEYTELDCYLLQWLNQLSLSSGTITKKTQLHLSLYRYRGVRGKRTIQYNEGIERIRMGGNQQSVQPTGSVCIKSIILKEEKLDYDNCYVLAERGAERGRM